MSSSFRRELFFADVFNAVGDLNTDGFNALEEQVAKVLNLSREQELAQLKEAVDALFVKVQIAVEKNLERWEKYCEGNCFYIPESITKEDNEVVTDEQEWKEAQSLSTLERDSADVAKEAELDAQLEALRNRILTVKRESSKLNKDCKTLEVLLNCKRSKVDGVARAAMLIDENKLSTIEAEISRAGARLLERMKNSEMQTTESTVADPRSKAAFAKLLNEVL